MGLRSIAQRYARGSAAREPTNASSPHSRGHDHEQETRSEEANSLPEGRETGTPGGGKAAAGENHHEDGTEERTEGRSENRSQDRSEGGTAREKSRRA